MSDNATVQIPNDVLKPIIEAKIIEALGGERRLLEEMVQMICNSQVERNYRKVPWIDAVCRDALVDSTQKAVKAWVEAHKDAMEKAVERELSKNTRSVAKMLVESFSARAACGYTVQVSIADDKP